MDVPKRRRKGSDPTFDNEDLMQRVQQNILAMFSSGGSTVEMQESFRESPPARKRRARVAAEAPTEERASPFDKEDSQGQFRPDYAQEDECHHQPGW